MVSFWYLLLWQHRFGVSDSAINKLLRFIVVFFGMLRIVLPQANLISHLLPTSVQLARQKFHSDKFIKYTVCPRCHSLYDLEECFITIGNRRVPRQCTFVAYPNHPQQYHRRPCSAELLDTIILKDRTKRFVPKKIYAYNSISNTLKKYLLRPQFEELCESWRHRNVPQGYYADLYDGRVWSQFQVVDGHPFLSTPRNYAFMMNVDWFRPYKHTPSTIGAIYLSLMNLPRQLRYKKDNIFLVGLIPGPNEPSLTINTYLKPLVDELKLLWETGICCRSFSSPWFSNRYYCGLLCVACDIPASRKVGGFLSHSARLGCNKCLQNFSTLGSSAPDTYSHGTCPLRTDDEHRQ
ncbi:uncharacterized protein LOC134189178 [Corticium candelabrum]|uniref:uncharacterized protein LOC134189178 n=1 Tax=Corticium candelabrum TaxID=121492 RepID=UPI002E26008F|nr:uncharacterized protein LOC134189178 [Corticium candelabrum]